MMRRRVPYELPVVTLGLVSLCCITFAAESAGFDVASSLALRSEGATLYGLLGYPFVHFDVSHLRGNAMALLVAGWYVERVYSGRTLLGLLIAVHIASFPIIVALLGVADVPVIFAGASTLAFGTLGFASVDLLSRREWRPYVGLGVLLAVVGVSVFGLVEMGIAPGGGITAAAHLMGVVIGSVLGAYEKFRPPSKPYHAERSAS